MPLWQPYFSFQLFFNDLDRDLYEYFKFFEEDNEVEYISDRTVKVESFEELALLSTGREYLQNENATPQQVNKKPQTLKDLICHEKSNEIVEAIKIKYKNIKGKRLKLLLMAFQELKLIPRERESSNFYRLCKSEFNWEIASYTAMNDYAYNIKIDEVEFSEMKLFIKNLINQ